MILTGFGGEVWVQLSYPVWVIGGILALHAGWLTGYWLGAKLR
jgi:hypothetical protein